MSYVRTVIDLHIVNLDDPAPKWAALEAGVSPAEVARGRRLRRERAQRRFLAGRAALRALLAGRTGRPGCDLVLSEGEGRPELVGGGVAFSLSRSAGRGLIALTSGAPVGCDIEWIDPELDLETTANAALSPSERAILAAADPAAARELFFQTWVLKEAYLKAGGVGLAEPPEGLTVLFGGPSGRGPTQWSLPPGWSWAFVEAGADWAAAVAAPGGTLTVRGPFPWAFAPPV